MAYLHLNDMKKNIFITYIASSRFFSYIKNVVKTCIAIFSVLYNKINYQLICFIRDLSLKKNYPLKTLNFKHPEIEKKTFLLKCIYD